MNRFMIWFFFVPAIALEVLAVIVTSHYAARHDFAGTAVWGLIALAWVGIIIWLAIIPFCIER